MSEESEKKGWLARLRAGLSRSSSRLYDGIGGIFSGRKLDDAALEELEDLLITSDLGVETAAKISASLVGIRFDKEVSADEIRTALADEVPPSWNRSPGRWRPMPVIAHMSSSSLGSTGPARRRPSASSPNA